MLLGYNTNGMAHHELLDAVGLLAEIGYRSVAVTIDHHALPPGGRQTPGQLRELRRLLDRFGMHSVVETGARFLLDPRRKHEPTLVSPERADRQRRIDFYKHAVRVAAELRSDCVSLWSGTVHDDASPEEALDRLAEGMAEVLDFAAEHSVLIGFEPEPGMAVDSMAGYEQLLERIDEATLRLTLDVGHLHCQGETPIDRQIHRWADRLANVHIEDMRHGVHEHLMFGSGEIDFPPILRALADVGYAGPLHVELSRHSHQAPQAARRAFEFLDGLMKEQRQN